MEERAKSSPGGEKPLQRSAARDKMERGGLTCDPDQRVSGAVEESPQQNVLGQPAHCKSLLAAQRRRSGTERGARALLRGPAGAAGKQRGGGGRERERGPGGGCSSAAEAASGSACDSLPSASAPA